ncbi:hypothetical protein F5884DRAFT_886577 [Xylogone sp. PMI_703]|nr:hypothetical protein F5884DRAFT_886577 [Xylogone sp. PMI_703]
MLVSCDFEQWDRDGLVSHYCTFESEYPFEGTREPGPDDFMPPLIVAISLGNIDLVHLLIDHGANINIGYYGSCEPSSPNRFWGTAIQLAGKLGHQEIVDLLLKSGADINKEYTMDWYSRPRPGVVVSSD